MCISLSMGTRQREIPSLPLPRQFGNTEQKAREVSAERLMGGYREDDKKYSGLVRFPFLSDFGEVRIHHLMTAPLAFTRNG